MRPISVLLTNNALGGRAGSEIYVRDVALALLRRGHRPVAFSLVLGNVAAELRRATIPVVDDLTRLGEAPDVIHGHHHLETLMATLTFPAAPVVNFCHGWLPWEEMPLHHPAVRRYVAVDEVCVDRLVSEEGISRSRVELLLNFVDLDRFRPRAPLPPRPRRALVLSNEATAGGYAGAIVAACQAAGISVDLVGSAAGNPSDAPEDLLPAYDLVFAKGRTALEALAVGCAVVLGHAVGAGPLVTPDNYEALRNRNFGLRELRQPNEPVWYERQIAGYCPTAAAEVSARVRAEAGLEPAIDRLLGIYAAAMTSPPGPGDPSSAAAIHCARLARPLKETYFLGQRLRTVTTQLDSAQVQIEAYSQAAREHQDQLAAAQECSRQLASAHAELHALQDQSAQLASARAELQALQEDQAAQLASARAELHAVQEDRAAQLASARAGLHALQDQAAQLAYARAELHDLQGQAAQLASARAALLVLQEDQAAQLASARAELHALQGQAAQLASARAELLALQKDQAAQLASARAELRALQSRLAAFEALPTLRLRDALLKAPVVGSLLQVSARRLVRLLR